MAAPLYTTASGLLFHAGKILVVTVGLPARGKTHISRALERYLRWLGVKTLVVSLGDHRRKTLGGAQQIPKDYFTMGEKSEATKKLRASVAEGCENQIGKFFDEGGQVVIYDANNGTRAARAALASKFENTNIHVIFLESICNSKEIIEANIRSVKISSPDYKNWDPERAVEDYFNRIRDHERYYEPVRETDWPFIRIFNVGDKIEVNKIQGYLQSRIIFFLMNIHNKYRTIYFARSGQSLIEHSYKADSDLSPAGWEYAARLKDFVLERRAKALQERGLEPAERKLVIWTSARRRAHHTAWPFVTQYGSSGVSSPYPAMQSNPASRINTPLLQAVTNAALNAPGGLQIPSQIPSLHLPEPASPSTKEADLSPPKSALQQQQSLAPSGSVPSTGQAPRLFSSVKVVEKQQMSEINPGVWDGLSPDSAQKLYPDDWARFLKDPYAFRAPRAESYHDLSVRLEPILIELEREQEDLLIIGHASVIRCLLAYLIGLPASEIPAIEVARGDLLEVRPASYGVHSQAYHFWDGPGRRGSSGASANAAENKLLRGIKGLGLSGIGPGGSDGAGAGKSRPGSAPGVRRSGSKARMSLGAESIEAPASLGGELSKTDSKEGAGGGAGPFGPAVGSDAESDALDDGDEGEDGNDSDGSQNFYENYAEDTKGKRKVDIDPDHSSTV